MGCYFLARKSEPNLARPFEFATSTLRLIWPSPRINYWAYLVDRPRSIKIRARNKLIDVLQ